MGAGYVLCGRLQAGLHSRVRHLSLKGFPLVMLHARQILACTGNSVLAPRQLLHALLYLLRPCSRASLYLTRPCVRTSLHLTSMDDVHGGTSVAGGRTPGATGGNAIGL